MINHLKNCQKSTLIGQLPDIINSNNQAITNEFNWIFDSSLNRLTKSVYAPTGSVKSHFGEFTNLSCEYITVKNVESLKNSMQSSIDADIKKSFDDLKEYIEHVIDPSNASTIIDPSSWILNHNFLSNRFKDESLQELGYMHDGDSIICKFNDSEVISVSEKLIKICDDINTIHEDIKRIGGGGTTVDASILELENKVLDVSQRLNSTNQSVASLRATIQNVNRNIDLLNNRIIGLSHTYIEYNVDNISEYVSIKDKVAYILINPNIYTSIVPEVFGKLEATGIQAIVFNLKYSEDSHEYKFRFDVRSGFECFFIQYSNAPERYNVIPMLDTYDYNFLNNSRDVILEYIPDQNYGYRINNINGDPDVPFPAEVKKFIYEMRIIDHLVTHSRYLKK